MRGRANSYSFIAGCVAFLVGCVDPEVPLAVLSASQSTCQLDGAGSVRCWGSTVRTDIGAEDQPGFRWPIVELPSRATDLAVGTEHACAVLDSGMMACWGRAGDYPRLGHSLSGSTSPAVLTFVGEPFVTVDVNAFHSCGVTQGGALWCWGADNSGVLGHAGSQAIGDDEEVKEAGPVRLTERVVDVATGHSFTCALLEDGGVRCWGRGSPQAGTHPGCLADCDSFFCCPTYLPTELANVPLPQPVVQLSAGVSHACALTSFGDVYCWGPRGAYGSYPTAGRVGDDASPLEWGPVPIGGAAVAISAGGRHTCALLDGGRVRCWGDNARGQLGLGSPGFVGDNERPSEPDDVQLGTAAVSVAAGVDHTCAELQNGEILCWGAPGELGVPADDDASCSDTRTNPDRGHGSPPTLSEFDCSNGPTCCLGDDEHPEDGSWVPL